jgi:hypothetical protein
MYSNLSEENILRLMEREISKTREIMGRWIYLAGVRLGEMVSSCRTICLRQSLSRFGYLGVRNRCSPYHIMQMPKNFNFLAVTSRSTLLQCARCNFPLAYYAAWHNSFPVRIIISSKNMIISQL